MIQECDGRAIVLARLLWHHSVVQRDRHNGEGIDLVDAHGCAVSANTFPLKKMPPKVKDGIGTPNKTGTGSRMKAKKTGNTFCEGACPGFVSASKKFPHLRHRSLGAGQSLDPGASYCHSEGRTTNSSSAATWLWPRLARPECGHLVVSGTVTGRVISKQVRFPSRSLQKMRPLLMTT